MTVLFAAAFKDCAIIGADSTRTDLSWGDWTVDKTRQISPGIVAAKFGYSGPMADMIWDEIDRLPMSEKASISTLLARSVEICRPVYEERRKSFEAEGKGDYGLTLLFATWSNEDGSGIHWIDFKMGNGVPYSHYYRTSGPGIIGQGPENAQSALNATYQASVVENSVDADLWAVRYIQTCREFSDVRLGCPANLRIVSSSGTVCRSVPETTSGGFLVEV